MIDCTFLNVSKISIIGYGIMSNNDVLKRTIKVIKQNKVPVLRINFSESKIVIVFKGIVSNTLVEEMHKVLI